MRATMLTQLAVATFLARNTVVPAGPPPSAPSMSGPMNPVTKVKKLLENMSTQLSAEQKADEEIYEKFSCWCETTEKEKTDAIDAADATRLEIEASIEDGVATVSKLSSEIKQLKEERDQEKAAIATASEMRSKEKEQFEATVGEMRATVESIDAALAALKSGTGLTALAQVQLLQKAAILHKADPALSSWLQSTQQQPANFKSYNARSGQIVGILAQMKDDFTADIKQEVESEEHAAAIYTKLVAAKEAQIKQCTARILKRTQQRTDAQVALVQAKHDLQDLEKQYGDDLKVLADARDRCPKMDNDFSERRAQRQQEISAINDALSILSDDSARDLFSSTFSFVQKQDTVRGKVVDVLSRAAAKTGSAALAQLATKAQLDAFTKVKAYIDEMIAALTKEQAAEVEHRTWCQDELRKNAVESKDKAWEKEDLEKVNNDLAEQIETLDSDLQALRAAISENLKAIKHASEDRAAENTEFKQVVADQRGAIMILNKVLERLQQVYAPDVLAEKKQQAATAADNAAIAERNSMTPGAAKNGIRVGNDQKALLQQPKGFGGSPYKKQSSGGVLGLIEETIGDAQRLVDEAIHSEQSSQAAYETFTKDASASLAADRQGVAHKTEERAKAAIAKDTTERDLEAAGVALDDLAKQASGIHAACDFVLNNFDLRQSARADEIDALQSAKAILSGADFQ